ncbi:MAG: rhamnulokinase family protein [Eubacteriales bacterium]
MKYYLAIDIGASSGRHILGHIEDGRIVTEEIHRFSNGVKELDGSLTWDTEHLLYEIKVGIAKAKALHSDIVSLSVDTWGVDYVLLDGDKEIYPVCAYRDSRTEKVIPRVHEKVPFSVLYERTGCQFQPFNSIYQLCCDKESGKLDGATDFLMMPEYFLYKLCGTKAHEYTNATTTGLINAETGDYDMEIIERLGLPKHLFGKLLSPGTVIGEYEGIKCVLCATHDTGSAVEGIPMEGNELYISSGTWSLLGVKTDKPITSKESESANYSNEGGVGYNRYQKNIMGMWVVNELKRHLCPEMSFSEIVKLAEESDCTLSLDVDGQEFLAPENMAKLFDEKSGNSLHTLGDYFRCAYNSLASSYEKAIRELERNTGKTYKKLYIVGGGAKNALLNRLTEKKTKKEVVALPIEATSLGNLKIQTEADI